METGCTGVQFQVSQAKHLNNYVNMVFLFFIVTTFAKNSKTCFQFVIMGHCVQIAKGIVLFNTFQNKAITQQNVEKVKGSECFLKALYEEFMTVSTNIFHKTLVFFSPEMIASICV